MKLEGVTTALVTPFVQEEVDYQGLRDNIKMQIKAGVSGILPLGTTGETPTLTEEEQNNIIQLAREESAGKVTLMVGTGHNCTRETISATRRAKELGADIALVVTPYYNKPTQEGIFRHYQAITTEVDIPVLVYNIKGRTGVNIETPTLRRLSELSNIIGVKEASGDIAQMGDVIAGIQSRTPTFNVLSGDDAMTLPLLSLGGRGIVSVVANLVPDRIVAMVRAGLEGDFPRARELHYELLPLFKAAFIESNPIPIKEAMQMCGLPAGKCRLPMCEMRPENRDKLRSVLREMGLLEKI